MTVITGSGTQELDLLFLAPGAGRTQQAVGESTGDDVAHHIQRSGAANEDLLCLAAQDLGPVSAGRGQTGQLAVVTGVDITVEAILGTVHYL